MGIFKRAMIYKWVFIVISVFVCQRVHLFFLQMAGLENSDVLQTCPLGFCSNLHVWIETWIFVQVSSSLFIHIHKSTYKSRTYKIHTNIYKSKKWSTKSIQNPMVNSLTQRQTHARPSDTAYSAAPAAAAPTPEAESRKSSDQLDQ